jgi:hypothetical protein
MIKSAQITLGGIKTISQWSKVPKQSWGGDEEKSKGPKRFELLKNN